MKKTDINITYTSYELLSELDDKAQALLNEAQIASEKAYAPYSNFKVGAALQLSSGEIISGSNQENASFPVGLCAERAALAHLAATNFEKKIDSIAIYVNNSSGQSPAAPCGMCRQALYEQEQKQQSPIKILLKGNADEIIEIASVKDILPLGFSGSDLK